MLMNRNLGGVSHALSFGEGLRRITGNKYLLAAIIIILIGVAYFGYQTLGAKSTTPNYQTAQVEKGVLITSVTASGTVSAGNSVSITTSSSGVVNNVYVSDGDIVTQGQKIGEIALDQSSQQKQAAAWASYLSAINSLKSAEQGKLSADAAMWNVQQSVLSAQNAVDLKNSNSTNPSTKQEYTQLEKENVDTALIQAKKEFSANEKKYLESQSAISAASASVNSTWLAYQQISSVITAPASGKISGLTLTVGLPISSSASSSNSSESSSNSSSTQSLGTITLEQGQLQATVNLTEIDVTKVKVGQKVTMTLDAFPNKTFTGKVLTINTNGVVSSGVTTYPATIGFDTALANIYPNMAVNATIITNVKENVVLVPSSAVQTSNGETSVRVMRNNVLTVVPVEIGEANDTQTEIISGINEGDTVVVGQISTGGTTGSTGTGTSPFGATRGGFGGGGGNFVRINR